MYLTEMLTLSKAENGYTISCHVPFTSTSKATEKMVECCSHKTATDKQYIAKTAKEATALISDLLPLLDGDYAKESEFDSAFEAATKEMKESN